jgi:hypothetical protein
MRRPDAGRGEAQEKQDGCSPHVVLLRRSPMKGDKRESPSKKEDSLTRELPARDP